MIRNRCPIHPSAPIATMPEITSGSVGVTHRNGSGIDEITVPTRAEKKTVVAVESWAARMRVVTE